MKLWKKNIDIESRIEEFTVGKDRDLDVHLAPFDVLGSIAHISMLASIDLISKEELKSLKVELINIYKEILENEFKIEDGVEDVHSQVEMILTKRLGDIGKKIHSGRSRNDQVLLDLKLFTRSEIKNITKNIEQLFATLQKLSEKHKDVLIPGYTHTQIAMPSSFGLWFGAYAESLSDDLLILEAAFKLANKNPLGSAAGYGSSFPLNRNMTTELLGFESMNYNVVYAQMGRGKVEKIVANAIASIAETLGKMSMDICVFMSQNFGFLTFPDSLTTGSSIMPHKKNPDVFELIRAKSNKLIALPNEISMITSNLISGYHRDLQLIKENFMPAFAEIQDCLSITDYMLQHIIINKDILADSKYDYLFSVEEVNRRVLSGTPFRDAYKQVGQEIESGNFEVNKDVKHTHEGSIGNLCNNEILLQMKAVIERLNISFARIEKCEKDLII